MAGHISIYSLHSLLGLPSSSLASSPSKVAGHPILRFSKPTQIKPKYYVFIYIYIEGNCNIVNAKEKQSVCFLLEITGLLSIIIILCV